MKIMIRTGFWISLAFVVLGWRIARADTVNVAVAANFIDTAREIARAFQETTGHQAQLSFGASGQFYTQIKLGAPFQIFLSADDTRPRKLIDEGLGVADEEFIYAIGKLVLWSPKPGLVINEETLKRGSFTRIAIANPTLAPYGAAAVEVMNALDVYASLQPKILLGNSLAQTFQFVKTENADYGFIALSQILKKKEGSFWIVPGNFYREINQGAVLLKSGMNNVAARAFMTFLKSSKAQSIIRQHGYGTGANVSRMK